MKKVLTVFATFAIFLLLLEVLVRHFIIEQDFEYFTVNSSSKPFFKLCNECSKTLCKLNKNKCDKNITIKNGRRELLNRGDRDRKIAFVGDSVLFGSGIDDKRIFTEIIQNKQNKYDIYNYGVEGYGFPEISFVVDDIIENNSADHIIYFFVLNDTYKAMAKYLPFIDNNYKDFSNINNFIINKTNKPLKQFVKDNIKSIVVLHTVFNKIISRYKTSEKILKKALNNANSSNLCNGGSFNDMSLIAQVDSYKTSASAWREQYKSQEFKEKVGEFLYLLKSKVEEKGKRFTVMTHYDFLVMNNNDFNIISGVKGILSKADINTIDTYSVYKEHFKECGFYLDAGHLGVTGHNYIGKLLTEYINNID